MLTKMRFFFLFLGWLCIFAFFPLGNTSLGILCLLLAFVVGYVPEDLVKRFSTLEYKLLGVFSLIMVMSALTSAKPVESLVMTLAQILIFYLIFIGSDYLVKNYNHLSRVYLKIFYGTSLLSGLITLFKRYEAGVPYYRSSTLFTQVNGTGTVLLVAIILSLPVVMEQKTLVRKLSGLLGLLIPLGGLFFTLSRGAFIGFFAGMATYLARFRKTLLVVAVGFIILTLILFHFFPYGKARIGSIFSLEKNDDRLVIWGTSLKMASEHPVLGVGTGLFAAYFPKYKPETFKPNVSLAHNLELHILAEFGLLGFITFFALIFMVIKRNIELMKMYPDRMLYRGIFAVLVGFLVHNQVDGTMMGFELGSFFWALSGFVIHQYYAVMRIRED